VSDIRATHVDRPGKSGLELTHIDDVDRDARKDHIVPRRTGDIAGQQHVNHRGVRTFDAIAQIGSHRDILGIVRITKAVQTRIRHERQFIIRIAERRGDDFAGQQRNRAFEAHAEAARRAFGDGGTRAQNNVEDRTHSGGRRHSRCIARRRRAGRRIGRRCGRGRGCGRGRCRRDVDARRGNPLTTDFTTTVVRRVDVEISAILNQRIDGERRVLQRRATDGQCRERRRVVRPCTIGEEVVADRTIDARNTFVDVRHGDRAGQVDCRRFEAVRVVRENHQEALRATLAARYRWYFLTGRAVGDEADRLDDWRVGGGRCDRRRVGGGRGVRRRRSCGGSARRCAGACWRARHGRGWCRGWRVVVMDGDRDLLAFCEGTTTGLIAGCDVGDERQMRVSFDHCIIDHKNGEVLARTVTRRGKLARQRAERDLTAG